MSPEIDRKISTLDEVKKQKRLLFVVKGEQGWDKKSNENVFKLIFEFSQMQKRTFRVPMRLKGNKAAILELLKAFYARHSKFFYI